MIEIEPRPLTERERSVLAKIYAALGEPARETMLAQLDHLSVTARWAADSASVEIQPAAGHRPARADVPGGVLPVDAVVYDDAELVGEILVWIESGVLAGIEYAYYMGDTPAELPAPDQVTVP